MFLLYQYLVKDEDFYSLQTDVAVAVQISSLGRDQMLRCHTLPNLFLC